MLDEVDEASASKPDNDKIVQERCGECFQSPCVGNSSKYYIRGSMIYRNEECTAGRFRLTTKFRHSVCIYILRSIYV